mmetsp:Transcript_701/g.1852  ORF Transcript_701/g.1852 Transcript_701/m.1852 type:complete len:231 (+) Transcript_701:963-1655(+)
MLDHRHLLCVQFQRVQRDALPLLLRQFSNHTRLQPPHHYGAGKECVELCLALGADPLCAGPEGILLAYTVALTKLAKPGHPGHKGRQDWMKLRRGIERGRSGHHYAPPRIAAERRAGPSALGLPILEEVGLVADDDLVRLSICTCAKSFVPYGKIVGGHDKLGRSTHKLPGMAQNLNGSSGQHMPKPLLCLISPHELKQRRRQDKCWPFVPVLHGNDQCLKCLSHAHLIG